MHCSAVMIPSFLDQFLQPLVHRDDGTVVVEQPWRRRLCWLGDIGKPMPISEHFRSACSAIIGVTGDKIDDADRASHRRAKTFIFQRNLLSNFSYIFILTAQQQKIGCDQPPRKSIATRIMPINAAAPSNHQIALILRSV